jgi:group I intron endonuclease
MIATGENLRKVSGIYCAIERKTGKCYVGSSVNIHRRYRDHIYAAKRGSRNCFHKALTNLGFEAFDFEILERCEKDKLLDRERLYIALLNSASIHGFNIRSKPTANYDVKISESTRERMSKNRLGKKHSVETCAKIGEANRSRVFTPELRQKIGRSTRGRVHSEETKRKISESTKGRSKTIETKIKMSMWKRTAEQIEKCAKAKRGTKRTPLQIANMLAGKAVAKAQRLQLFT